MSLRTIPTLALASLLALSACNGMQLQQREPGAVPGTGPFPAPGVSGNTPQTRNGQPAQRTRQICRGEKPPRGFVTIDYISMNGTCGAGMKQDPGPNVALVTEVGPLVAETVLVVCADQFVPQGWEHAPAEDTDASNTACPRLRGDPKTGPTVMRIRKVR